MARPFDHRLHVVLPRHLRELAQRAQLGHLRVVVGVGQRARAQAVAQRERDVVRLHDLADLLEVREQEVLAAVRHAPLGEDRAAARDDAGAPARRQLDELGQHAGVDGEVVDALLGLLDQRVAKQRPAQLLGDAAHLLERLVDRHRADRHRAVAQDPVARGVDVGAGGQVHHRVGAPARGPYQLVDFLLDARRGGRVADVGVDLDQEVAPDRHRLEFGVVDVGRDDGAAARHLVAHELGRDALRDRGAARIAAQTLLALGVARVLGHPFVAAVLAQRDELHLRRDDAASRVVQLRHVASGDGAPRRALQAVGLAAQRGDAGGNRTGRRRAQALAVVHRRGGAAGVGLGVAAPGDPARTHGLQAAAQVDQRGRVRVRPRGVVDGDLLAVGERDLAHRHADAGLQPLHAHLARGGQRLARRGGGMAAIVDIRRIGGGGVGGLGGQRGVRVGRQGHLGSSPKVRLLAPDGAPTLAGRRQTGISLRTCAALLTPVLAGSSSRVRPRLPIHWSSQHLLSDAPRSEREFTPCRRLGNDQFRVCLDTGRGI